MKPAGLILVVDDNPNDVVMTVAALRKQNLPHLIEVVNDGAEALDYLYRRGDFVNRDGGHPQAVLLDLKMPRVDGLEVLRQIKADAALKMIPVIMLTSSRETSDVLKCYQLGVNAYVVKPVNYQEFIETLRGLGSFWSLVNEPPPQSAAAPCAFARGEHELTTRAA